MHDARLEVTPKCNAKVISNFRFKWLEHFDVFMLFTKLYLYIFIDSRILDFQEYNSRKRANHCEHALRAVMYACPYTN